VAVASPNDLAALTVERDPITRLSSEHGVDTIGAYAREEHAVRIRDLCAGIGAIEEPASGTTSGALALALHELEALSESAMLDVTMGVEMGRPSRLRVRLESVGGHLTANVSGTARRLLTGRLEA
jgi:predicted PhzF superfamily epimerase YddE/YHI9